MDDFGVPPNLGNLHMRKNMYLGQLKVFGSRFASGSAGERGHAVDSTGRLAAEATSWKQTVYPPEI